MSDILHLLRLRCIYSTSFCIWGDSPYCLFDTDKYEGYGQFHPSYSLSFGDSTVRMHSQLTISNTMALRRSSEKSRIWCQVLHYAVSSVNRSNIKFQVRTRDRRIEAFFSFLLNPPSSWKHQPFQRPHPTLSVSDFTIPSPSLSKLLEILSAVSPKVWRPWIYFAFWAATHCI